MHAHIQHIHKLSTYTYIYRYAYIHNHQVIAQTLQGGLASTYAICLPVAALIVCLALAPLVASFRKLSSSIWLCLANMVVLLVAILIVVGKLVVTGRPDNVKTKAFADSLNFYTLFEAATNIGA